MAGEYFLFGGKTLPITNRPMDQNERVAYAARAAAAEAEDQRLMEQAFGPPTAAEMKEMGFSDSYIQQNAGKSAGELAKLTPDGISQDFPQIAAGGKQFMSSTGLTSASGLIGNVPTSLSLSGSGQLIDILLTKGQPAKNNELKYKIFIQFEGNDQNYYDDTLYLAVLRMALKKSASIYYLKINLTPVLVEQLKIMKNANQIIKLKMFIYTVQTDEQPAKLKNLVFERPFVLLEFKADTDASIEAGNTVSVTLIICNPTLYEMDNTYSYNKIHNTLTPYEIIQDYEGYITERYGDNFVSKHITNKLNQFKYEQTLTQLSDQGVKLPDGTEYTCKSQHDIDIPFYINNKYKADNCFGFYFFDDFNMQSEKEITRYFITFYDKNKFEKFKTDDQSDIIKQSQLTTSYPFADTGRVISKENAVFTSKLPNSEFSTQKEQQSTSISGSTQVQSEVQLSENDSKRSYQAQRTTETQKQQSGSANQQIIQTPDSNDATQERVNLAKEIMETKVDKVDQFTTNNCGFDWIQFGILYAMNADSPNEYLHTPLAIANVFHRENTKENVLVHMCRFLAVKFKPDEEANAEEKQEEAKTTTGSQEQTSKEVKTGKETKETKAKVGKSKKSSEKKPENKQITEPSVASTNNPAEAATKEPVIIDYDDAITPTIDGEDITINLSDKFTRSEPKAPTPPTAQQVNAATRSQTNDDDDDEIPPIGE